MYLSGKPNPIIGAGTGKPTWPQRAWTPSTYARAAVSKSGESNGYDPKPGDLRVGKVKRAERRVEAC